MRTMKRMIWRVKWLKDQKRWQIVDPSKGPEDYESWDRKKDAIDSARCSAKCHRIIYGNLSQLVIYGKNGRIQREYTYGRDPKRYKG